MCGIVGYIGKSIEVKDIVKTLKKLEYRGYDSSGLSCVLESGEEITVRKTGNISNLVNSVPKEKCNIAIAHTRWATHGVPSEENSHPQTSFCGDWKIVHNGIIENYKELKEQLKNKPQSQTDTAVAVQLLEERCVKDIQEFIDVVGELEGSYAIVAKNKSQNKLFVAKNKSPLFISKNHDGNVLIASDPICFVDFSQEYYEMKNNEFAVVSEEVIEFFNYRKEKIAKCVENLTNEFEDFSKEGYEHFMIKEIMEQKQALKRQVKIFQEKQILKRFDKEFIQKFNKVVFVGCGTAYNASLVGAKYFEKLTGKPASAEIASEFLCKNPNFIDEKTLSIFISQSGETADTIRALEVAKQNKSTTIAVTNVLYSSLAKSADIVIPVCAGPEIAVASTKAYTCQLSALYMFASKLAIKTEIDEEMYYCDILKIADKILNFDYKKIDSIAEELKNKDNVIFIGKDLDYITAREASLKLKEVAYINTSHYYSGELKHGYIALVEKGTPIIVFANNKNINPKTFNASNEACSRGAVEYIFTNENIEEDKKRKVIKFEVENELLYPILSIVPLQYLAYKVSLLKNINPDQPRNLAKSVTVE